MGVLGASLTLCNCTPPTGRPEPQRTTINGHVSNRFFVDGRAAFSNAGSPPAALIRIMERSDMPRDDVCEASTDPSAVLDPTLVLSVFPAEPGEYPIIITNNRDAGAPARYATATLFTFQDDADGGLALTRDGGLIPSVLQARGGQVKILAVDGQEGGALNAEILVEFADGEAYSGQLGAVLCEAVR